jgi:hypothetical protein
MLADRAAGWGATGLRTRGARQRECTCPKGACHTIRSPHPGAPCTADQYASKREPQLEHSSSADRSFSECLSTEMLTLAFGEDSAGHNRISSANESGMAPHPV